MEPRWRTESAHVRVCLCLDVSPSLMDLQAGVLGGGWFRMCNDGMKLCDTVIKVLWFLNYFTGCFGVVLRLGKGKEHSGCGWHHLTVGKNERERCLLLCGCLLTRFLCFCLFPTSCGLFLPAGPLCRATRLGQPAMHWNLHTLWAEV